MANPSFRAARGTRDILPDEIPLWDWVEGAARELFRRAGYREIRPPLLEETELFTRSIGEVTDIVEKEMFTVKREDSSYTFRPEGTAGVVRAYLEAGLHRTKPFQKFFYIGPMFRYERPQKGRERQFFQIGIEALGSLDPFLDAEAIDLAASFFETLGIRGLEIRVNSMGDAVDRERYRETLKAFLAPQIASYCEQCRTRFQRNVFRVLDCKSPADIEKNKRAPSILASLAPETAAHFESVKQALAAMGREVRVDPGTVRGLDYYTRTVFEIHDPTLGARSALCGGGRYDKLIAELGGSDLGAVGFAIGVTSTLIALESRKLSPPARAAALQAYLIVGEGGSRLEAMKLAQTLRAAGIAAEYPHEDGKSLQSQLRAANGLGVPIVVFCTPRLWGVKSMANGQQFDVPVGDPAKLVAQVRDLLA